MRHLHLYSKCGDGVCYCWQWGLENRLRAIGFPRSDDPEGQARDDAALARQRESIIYAFTGSWRLSEEAAALPPEALRSLQEQALAQARMHWTSREPSQWTTRIVSVSTSGGRVSATEGGVGGTAMLYFSVAASSLKTALRLLSLWPPPKK